MTQTTGRITDTFQRMIRSVSYAKLTATNTMLGSLTAMRRAAALSFLLVSLPAWAADITTETRPNAVTVFPDRAVVTRWGQVKLPAGAHTLVVQGLPSGLVPESLRVTGSGPAGLMIGSVESKVVTRQDLVHEQERLLYARLTELRDKRKLTEAQSRSLQLRQSFIESLAKTAADGLAGESVDGQMRPDQWEAAWLRLQAGSEQTLKDLAGQEIALRGLDEQIRKAEADLLSANANIGVARAKLLPSFNLTGQLGMGSRDLSTWISPASAFYTLTANLAATIFDNGATANEIAYQEARWNEMAATYARAVLNSLRDVENALAAQRLSLDYEKSSDEAVKLARQAHKLSQSAFEIGMTDYLRVLETERNLYKSEDQRVLARSSRLLAALALYKSLGGGAVLPDDPLDSLSRDPAKKEKGK